MENGYVRGGSPKGSLRKDLVAGHAEGAAAGGMTGLGETYLPAFALAVGLGEITAGLVASVPLKRLGSHKRWVLLCVLVQLSFVPRPCGDRRADFRRWNSHRGGRLLGSGCHRPGLEYLDGRPGSRPPRPLLRLPHADDATGGASRICRRRCLLQWASRREAATYAFALISRSWSLPAGSSMLALQREPRHCESGIRPRPSARLARIASRQRRRALPCTVRPSIAGPFFTPFMFEWLELSYLGYMVLIATAYAAKIAMLPVWGSIAHRLGPAAMDRRGGHRADLRCGSSPTSSPGSCWPRCSRRRLGRVRTRLLPDVLRVDPRRRADRR